MTQAFNLAQLANNTNTSGQLDATDGLTGLIANANLASTGTPSASTFLRGDRVWASVPQKLVQVVYGASSSREIFNVPSAGSYFDTALAASITPTSTSSQILVMITATHQSFYAGTPNVNSTLRIKRNTTPITGFVSAHTGTITNAETMAPATSIIMVDTPSSTSAVTYTVQISSTNGGIQVYFNGNYSLSSGFSSFITLMEIAV